MTIVEVRYCLNGCTTKRADTQWPTQVTAPAVVCGRCVDQMQAWLRDIPHTYALLPTFVEHGSIERNPDAKTTKATEAAAPLRLEIVDLLDARYGRKWNGTAPAHLRRGVLGDLQAHVDALAEHRGITTNPTDTTTVTGACKFLTRHLPWATTQDWVTWLYKDLKHLNRALSDAVGEYRRPPVGHCHLTPTTPDKPCGGPLYPSTYGGVHCTRCNATWNPNQLRLLGLTITQPQEESA